LHQLAVTLNFLAGATIVFDLDGTLIDTAPDLIGAANHVLAGLALSPRPAEALKPWISFGARRMIVEALAQCDADRSEAEVDHLLASFLTHYEGNIAQLSRPFPNVIEEIADLTSAGARVAICTNKREALAVKLIDALDLSGLFTAIIGRDTLPVCKPDPGHLTGTIVRAGGMIERAVMVGDSGVDIATARAAGVPVVGVTFGYSDAPISTLNPDVAIDTYAGLQGVLGGLLRSK
jgi:phosphoglycolate phosphatase